MPGMQDGDLSTYDKRRGDLPKFMPWDTSLNNDLHLAVKRHVLLTKEFETGNAKKFDMSTPARGTAAYLRILDPITGGVPSSRRIVQDVTSVLESMMIVYECQGTVVQGLGDRSGKRQPAAAVAVAVHDDDAAVAVPVAVNERLEQMKQQKKIAAKENEIVEKWTHPDACEGRSAILKISTVKYETMRASQQT